MVGSLPRRADQARASGGTSPSAANTTRRGGRRGTSGPRTVSDGIVGPRRVAADRRRRRIRRAATAPSPRAGSARSSASGRRVGDAGVERGGELERDVGTAAVAPCDGGTTAFCAAASPLQQADLHLDSLPPQLLGATGRTGFGIGDRRHHPPHAGGEQRLGARRLLPLVGAGLERATKRRPASPLPRRGQRHRLRMPLAELGVAALADDFAVAEHDGAHQRIRLHASPPCQASSMARAIASGSVTAPLSPAVGRRTHPRCLGGSRR